MIVAAEGAGKSVATRQLAICAAQGVHPFRFSTMPPVRTLIVDLENPDDAIAQTCKPITARAKLAAQDYEPGRAWLWRQPGGVDLRTRVGRGRLEAVVAATQPDLVCLGPVYKAYRSSAKESDELAAGEVQGVLDDLRTRYRFAVVLEHHAPKAQGGYRDLLPYGSSLWLRWPELGVKFTQDQNDKRSVKVGRFRQDRVEASWPDRLDRGGLWPWTGFWHNAEEASA
jgi:replicative DNA helicase